MTTANVASLGEQLKTHLSDAVEKTKEISEGIRDRVGSGYRAVHRGVRNAKAATEDAIESTRGEIKERPLTITAAALATGFAAGLLTGWLIGSRRK